MTPARISGTTPGVLDSTQPHRILRRPSSTLSFASFDPRVASADHGWDMRSLSLNEELYRPKRVVIETTCSGESSWRFVPRARWDEGVVDEGSWPRVIDLCGQLVECSQDQWDIYKLDPAYDCLVRAPPEVAVVTLVSPKPAEPKQPLGKHRMSSAEPCPEMPPAKNLHLDSDSEEDEVADMVVDGGAVSDRRSSGPGNRAKKFRDEIEKNRQERREKGARRSEKLSTRDDVRFNFSFQDPPYPQPPAIQTPDIMGKRKVSSLFDSLRVQEDPEYFDRSPEEEAARNTANYAPINVSKRTRTFSPGAAKRDLETRRLEREKQKRARREKELNQRKQQRYQHFLNEIYSEVPNTAGPGNDEDVLDEFESGDESAELDPEAERMAFIAEARRKLAELEADRPLWEAEAKKRERQEKEEQEAQRARTAERRAAEARKVDEGRRAELEKERQQEQAKEENKARSSEQRARRERERRQRNERWAYGPWTTQRALERYKTLCDIFDSTKFSPEDPLTFDIIPWPILQTRFSIEDVDWAAVEAFFNAVKPHMRSQDFAAFVEKSHRRFHPDRWRSRGLLKSVANEAERGCLEVGANTVAQALTPLWRTLTGR